MRMRVLIVGALALGACADTATTTPEGIKFKVAPLTLPGITNACYTLTVENDVGDTVWTKSEICADTYGDNSGSITYIGPCDATDNNNSNEAVGPAGNSVTLELEGLWTGGDQLTDQNTTPAVPNPDFNNPCPVGTGCTLTFNCVENADVSVVFNISLMRSAKQGFFDIAVNFEDIFCSAKADCQDELLFQPDGEGSKRGPTAILAFACTAGEGSDTTLWMSDVNITCDNVLVASFNPAAGEGQHSGEGPLYAVYQGAEQLGDYNKLYWNVAIAASGLNLTGTCYLDAIATAADGDQTGLTPDNTTSPYVKFHVLVSPANSTTFSCENNPLNGTLSNGSNSGVNTVYDDVETEQCFEHYLARGEEDFTAFEGDTGACDL